MYSKLKKFTMSFLALVIIFSFSQPSLSNAEKKDSKIKVKTEVGSEIGFGNPKTKSKFPKNLKSKNEKVENNTIKQTINIDPSISNSTIEVPLELQYGEYIVLAKDEQGNTDGAGTIYNKENESIGIISTPVVENEENLNITSADVTNGDTIQLNLASDGLTEPTNLVMAATATYYSTYFSNGEWILRDGHNSISLTHKAYLHSGSTNDRMMKLGDSWNKVVAVHSGNSKWYNTNGLYDQYACHYNTIGSAKNPWNLEPARDDVSYATTLRYACNPPF